MLKSRKMHQNLIESREKVLGAARDISSQVKILLSDPRARWDGLVRLCFGSQEQDAGQPIWKFY